MSKTGKLSEIEEALERMWADHRVTFLRAVVSYDVALRSGVDMTNLLPNEAVEFTLHDGMTRPILRSVLPGENA